MAAGRASRARRDAGPSRHGSRRDPGHGRHPARGTLTGLLVVFLDGVGIGPADPEVNPFLRARLPTLRGFLGGAIPTLEAPVLGGDAPTGSGSDAGTRSAVAFPLDATLGVDGLPQSGTGQATLLTGENGAALHGSHFGPWIPVRLRPLVEERSLLRRAVTAGISSAFANAYPADWPAGGRRRVAGPPLAARGAGLLTRRHSDLRDRGAVASEIVNDGWRRWVGPASVPEVSAREAGVILAEIASAHRLTFFAHYSTDTAGHRGGMDGSVGALERVDTFLAGILDRLPANRTLMVVSDHGNIEDVRGGHTRNPALGLLVGPEARERALELEGLGDVAPRALDWLSA